MTSMTSANTASTPWCFFMRTARRACRAGPPCGQAPQRAERNALAPNLRCETQDDHRQQRVRRAEEAQPEQRVDGDDVGELVARAEQRADRRAHDDARQGLVARDDPLEGRHSLPEAAFLAELLYGLSYAV